MRYRLILFALALAFAAASFAAARSNPVSDPVGAFARIEKVVFEPSSGTPERVQIWGAFALAGRENGNAYKAPERGYLYFSVKPGKEEPCRKEWADLKAIAGTDQIIGFGMRYQAMRLRKATDTPTDPDVYPIGFGLIKISDRNSDYPPIRDLKAFPKEH